LDYSNFKQSLFTREWGDNVDDWNSHNSPSRVARQWGEIPQLVQAMHYANPPYLFTSYETLYRTPRQMIGGCLWHPFDHQRGYHPDPFYGGILDVFRQPKYAYYLFASQRTPIAAKGRAGTGPVVFIAHEMTPFSPADVTVFTNCEELRLIVNEKDTLVKKMQQEGGMPHPVAVFKEVFEFMDVKALHRSGNSQKASFVAEGLIGGIVVAKDKRMAALRPSKIILWVDNEGIPLVANGSDFIPVIAAMADEAGHVKRLNEYEISFKIEGEGEIIGGREIGANPRKVEWGTAPVLIRSTTQNGKIKVNASVSFAGITMPVSGEIEFESITANEQFLNGIKLPEVIKGAGSVYQEAVESDELLKRIVELERELNQYKLKEVEKQQAEFEGGSEK
jgi:beta-galactosidase